MARKIKQPIKIYHITSEPGDSTLYDYLIEETGYFPKTYRIYPRESTFPFPRYLTEATVEKIITGSKFNVGEFSEVAIDVAREVGCNVYTLYEVAVAISHLGCIEEKS